jgi:hypothetical protein
MYGKVFHDSTDLLRTARARQSIQGWHTETPSEYRDCQNKKRDHHSQWVAPRSKCHEDGLTERTEAYRSSEVHSWGLRVYPVRKIRIMFFQGNMGAASGRVNTFPRNDKIAPPESSGGDVYLSLATKRDIDSVDLFRSSLN